jgi:protein-tyrosine-phosphatase
LARGFWKGLRRGLKHIPDRLLHARRRRRALAWIAAASPQSVLFVCYGNVCRSPYAAAALERRLDGSGGGRAVASAGFARSGVPVPPEGVSAAARREIDLAEHRSAPVTADLLASAELVVVADPVYARLLRERFPPAPGAVIALGDLDPLPIDTRAIADPVERPEEVFDACYARIDRCVDQLARVLGVDGE